MRSHSALLIFLIFKAYEWTLSFDLQANVYWNGFQWLRASCCFGLFVPFIHSLQLYFSSLRWFCSNFRHFLLWRLCFWVHCGGSKHHKNYFFQIFTYIVGDSISFSRTRKFIEKFCILKDLIRYCMMAKYYLNFSWVTDSIEALVLKMARDSCLSVLQDCTYVVKITKKWSWEFECEKLQHQNRLHPINISFWRLQIDNPFLFKYWRNIYGCQLI